MRVKYRGGTPGNCKDVTKVLTYGETYFFKACSNPLEPTGRRWYVEVVNGAAYGSVDIEIDLVSSESVRESTLSN